MKMCVADPEYGGAARAVRRMRRFSRGSAPRVRHQYKRALILGNVICKTASQIGIRTFTRASQVTPRPTYLSGGDAHALARIAFLSSL